MKGVVFDFSASKVYGPMEEEEVQKLMEEWGVRVVKQTAEDGREALDWTISNLKFAFIPLSEKEELVQKIASVAPLRSH